VNRSWAGAATNNGQDRQVHEGVEGGHLVDDGDIHIQVFESWQLNNVIRVWAKTGNKSGRSMNARTPLVITCTRVDVR
jgi:hypothetical protein